MPSAYGDAMKRRSKAGGEPIKGRRRKTPGPKRRNAPKAVPRSKSYKSSPPGEPTEVARVTRERDEALEQQTATGDVLKVISRPSFSLQAVLDTLVKLAARLCEADLVAIHRPRDGAMQFAANFGLSQEWEEIIKRDPIVPGRGTATGRVLLASKTVQIADVEADPEYTFTEGQRAGGFRTVLAVPLEREGETIGVIVLCRTKVHPFTDKQIALVQNFATQAVIAIENARLLNELRQRTTDLTERTADLTEALEQQTATSEVLQVISSSPGDLQPVFATMLEKAVRLCDANFGNIYRWDGELSNLLASHNTPPALVEARKRLRIHFVPKDLVGQAIANKKAVHIADLAEHKDYIERSSPGAVAAVELGGVRTHVVVPMMKDDELIGTFHLSRQEVRPFTDKQIELVTNFAAQAVIAIENTRLLKELRERTVEVEKLNQQLEKRVADQVVVFNDPVPVENPALQAVLMALELRNALGALTQTWSRLGHEIGFGVGIAHGFATLGTIGYEGRFDYAAIGTVSNVASRLCDEAKPGQILISARVLMKVENVVTVEPVGEFELKGIRRPLAAYNVVAASPSKV